MNPIRLPLVENLEPRSATATKDSLTSNLFYDKDDTAVYAVKRPGISSYLSGQGAALGVFGWEDSFLQQDKAFSWYAINGLGIGLYANNKYVLLSTIFDTSPNYSITSSNGIDWELGYLPNLTAWRDIAWNGTVYCAVAFSGDYTGATSTDGLTWVSCPIPKSSWRGIASDGAGRFVIVGRDTTSGYAAMYSTDNGATWNTSNLPVNSSWNGIAYCSSLNMWCALTLAKGSLSSSVYISSDGGATWTPSGSFPFPAVLRQVVSNGTSFLLVGDPSFYVSTDGTSWTSYSNTINVLDTKVCWNGSNYYAKGDDFISGTAYKVYSSPTGATWTEVLTAPVYNYIPVASPTELLLVSVDDSIYYDSNFSASYTTREFNVVPYLPVEV